MRCAGPAGERAQADRGEHDPDRAGHERRELEKRPSRKAKDDTDDREDPHEPQEQAGRACREEGPGRARLGLGPHRHVRRDHRQSARVEDGESAGREGDTERELQLGSALPL